MLKFYPAEVEVTRKKLELKVQMTRKAEVGLRNAIDQGHKKDFKSIKLRKEALAGFEQKNESSG